MTDGEISAFEEALRRDGLQLKAEATALGGKLKHATQSLVIQTAIGELLDQRRAIL